MILRNHGLLVVGRRASPRRSLRLWTLQRACDVQIAGARRGARSTACPAECSTACWRESGPGEKRTCEDVFAALVRLVDARDPSYRTRTAIDVYVNVN